MPCQMPISSACPVAANCSALPGSPSILIGPSTSTPEEGHGVPEAFWKLRIWGSGIQLPGETAIRPRYPFIPQHSSALVV
ncbi:hypothetical protein K432DRAFT_222038 [Lepidopterella palustris CBS 459.81]|uniref:Uncharacterized protein n=1 Tax=Lepidopterella palustris CBS 459.81 TaxID=1314670 RepID=A0A8E2DYA4_9PEZI|nr:hypothetical protein K432DRAFT_222038 [Lepidopterella palustris CBS 459.81]